MIDPPRLPDPRSATGLPEESTEFLDSGPSSDVRPIETRARGLVLDTGLRGERATAAWLVVSSAEGFLLFEGAVSETGCVEVSLDDAPLVDRVRVMLETARGHRQAEVELNDGWTLHTFN
jgi:hypothetical protein